MSPSPQSTRHRIFAAVALAVSLSCAVAPSWAAAGKESKSSLSGGVSQAVIDCHSGLKEMARGAKLMERAALDLAGEVEITEYVVATQPDVIGPIIVPSVAFPEKQEGFAQLDQPKKKWLDYVIHEMTPLIKILASDVDALQLPPDASDDMKACVTEIKAQLADTQKHFDNVGPLTEKPPFDNLKIGKEAVGIYDNMQKISAQIKKINHFLQSSSKK